MSADPIDRFEPRSLLFSGGEYSNEEFRYRLLRTPTIEPGKSYPLVLYLHGAGERGDDNRAQIKYLPTWMTEPEYRQRFDCFLIAPQCRADRLWV